MASHEEEVSPPDVGEVLAAHRGSLEQLFDSYRDNQPMMGEAQFLKFCRKFDICPGLLTRVQVLHAFRGPTSKQSRVAWNRLSSETYVLTYEEFAECMSSCAAAAFDGEEWNASSAEKLRLFLHWLEKKSNVTPKKPLFRPRKVLTKARPVEDAAELRLLFAQYCTFGDRLNVGPNAALSRAQVVRLLRDSGCLDDPDRRQRVDVALASFGVKRRRFSFQHLVELVATLSDKEPRKGDKDDNVFQALLARHTADDNLYLSQRRRQQEQLNGTQPNGAEETTNARVSPLPAKQRRQGAAVGVVSSTSQQTSMCNVALQSKSTEFEAVATDVAAESTETPDRRKEDSGLLLTPMPEQEDAATSGDTEDDDPPAPRPLRELRRRIQSRLRDSKKVSRCPTRKKNDGIDGARNMARSPSEEKILTAAGKLCSGLDAYAIYGQQRDSLKVEEAISSPDILIKQAQRRRRDLRAIEEMLVDQSRRLAEMQTLFCQTQLGEKQCDGGRGGRRDSGVTSCPPALSVSTVKRPPDRVFDLEPVEASVDRSTWRNVAAVRTSPSSRRGWVIADPSKEDAAARNRSFEFWSAQHLESEREVAQGL